MYMWVESDPNQTQTQNKPKWKEKMKDGWDGRRTSPNKKNDRTRPCNWDNTSRSHSMTWS